MAESPQPIAIVGIGGIFSQSPTLSRFWTNIQEAVDTARPAPPGRWFLSAADAFDAKVGAADRVYSLNGCFIDDLQLDTRGLALDGALLARLDPLFHLALHACRQAFESAVTGDLDRSRVGVVLGNLALPTDASSALAREILGRTFEEQVVGADVPPSSSTEPLNRFVAGLPAGVVAKALGLGGGCWTLDAACASSLYALKFAVDELRSGRADAMLAGGISRPDCLYTQMGFSQLHALSPSGRAAPFAAAADGLVVGEGAGAFLLKRLPDALSAGDRIDAVIAGIGLSNDVEGKLLAPSTEGQLRAMRSAYAQAGWSPQDVDLIECHATGTPVGDAVEFRSLRTLWGDRGWKPGQCVIGSVKSNVGHTLTAAGSAGILKVILALREKTLPPTANFDRPAAGCPLGGSPFQILNRSRPWEPRSDRRRRAAISGFGFGGINAHVLIEENVAFRSAKGRPFAERKATIGRVSDLSPSLTDGDGSETWPAASSSGIAVVGMDARFGPWESLPAFQEHVLGAMEDCGAPEPPRRWWGVKRSAWFQNAGLSADEFRGWYLDKLSVPMDRFRIPPKELEEMLPQQLLMLHSAAAAIDDAKLSQEHLLRTGVFLGIALDLNTTNFHVRWSLLNRARVWNETLALGLSAEELAEWTRELRDAAGPPLTANRTMGALGSVIASRIAREFHLGGPSFTVSSEETSGLHALQTAVRLLQQGELDQAIVGAVDLAGDVRAVLAEQKLTTSPLPRYSGGEGPGVRGLNPRQPQATGAISSDGAATVILKRFEDAVRDGDRIYAVIKGIGSAVGGGVEIEPSAGASALSRALAEAQSRLSLRERTPFRGAKGDSAADAAQGDPSPIAIDIGQSEIGDPGAATGMASFVKACLCLYQEILPPQRSTSDSEMNRTDTPQFWLRNRADGPRRAAVAGRSVTGQCFSVIVEENPTNAVAAERVQPTGARQEALFAVEADSAPELQEVLRRLRNLAQSSAAISIEALARHWWSANPTNNQRRLGVALVARDVRELVDLLTLAARQIIDPARNILPQELGADRVFFAAEPLGPRGEVAFVFPGSGNHFPGMGRELSVQWPDVMRRQDASNRWLRRQILPEIFWNANSLEAVAPRDLILGQVSLGVLVSDVVRQFGVAPSAVIGYSLGETAGYFALGAWTARDEMLTRMHDSSLFSADLAGSRDAVRRTWKLPNDVVVDWRIGVVAAPAARVRQQLQGRRHVYLLLINTPNETVIGGDRSAVAALVRELSCPFVPLSGISTVHCEVVRPVESAYRDLHLLPTSTPAGLRFYSGAKGKAHEVTRESAAESILAQALHGMDFPALIEQAYSDGVRVFLEMGPGASCSRMIDLILDGRPHLAKSACVQGQDTVSTVLRLLGNLIAERVPVDLAPLYGQATRCVGHREKLLASARSVTVPVGGAPFRPRRAVARLHSVSFGAANEVMGSTEIPVSTTPEPIDPMIGQFSATASAQSQAHEAYLSFARNLESIYSQELSRQISLAAAATTVGRGEAPSHGSGGRRPLALDREQCLEFARGSVGRVLGPDFAEVDAFPTRVRLPDEPLMLVDRIVTITGEPRSMTSGKVVTEHDIHPGAWYLDCNRIPTCIAVEAGQADLFLSGYLGIDFQTRGLAVYRLLDAVVTFHRGLPGPGEVIHYDIEIERFILHGATYLFRFRFEGSVAGEPLLTMTEGCAGFFTEQELAAGKGIVHTELDRQPATGIRPADWRELATMRSESYDGRQIDALRRGDLHTCFGDLFGGLDLRDAVRLPGGRMRLVHRVTQLDPAGGKYGIGVIRAEADIHPDDLFLRCHFVDDRVMPGTLMFECCLHTLRIFLMRLGWVGEHAEAACEPVPGVASRLKCRGQVIESTRVATYEVVLKEIGYRPEPFVIADALIYADGKPIVEIADMSLRMAGLDRNKLEALWRGGSASLETRPALFDRERILAFAVGKPSEAFGEPYLVFDRERTIARLPGPPYQFLDRITAIDAEPWKLQAGGVIDAEYDVPADAWYFAANRQPTMPFAVLLEIALQPCGWLAAYVGSALASPIDLCFRNLGGQAVQHRRVTPNIGTLTTTVKITRVSNSVGMIIQHYDFAVRAAGDLVYQGDTYFGFFTREALANQVGVRDAKLYVADGAERARGQSFTYPAAPPFPDRQLRMMDRVALYVPDGGTHGFGFLEGVKTIDPEEWFFKAHFYQDPVWPGSLGLEAFLQLLKIAAVKRWGEGGIRFEDVALGKPHRWVYRGQVLPTNKEVSVQAVVTEVDDVGRILQADGFLIVDGRIIYQMNDFTLRMESASP